MIRSPSKEPTWLSIVTRTGILSDSSREMRVLWISDPKIWRSLKIDSVTKQSSNARPWVGREELASGSQS